MCRCCLYKYFRCLYKFFGFTTRPTALETDEKGQSRLTRLMRTRHCSFGVIYSIESLNGSRYFVIAFTNPSPACEEKTRLFLRSACLVDCNVAGQSAAVWRQRWRSYWRRGDTEKHDIWLFVCWCFCNRLNTSTR